MLSVRLGPTVESYLDDLVRRGLYPTKAEAIRAAMNTFAKIRDAKDHGYRVVAVTNEALQRLGVALEIT